MRIVGTILLLIISNLGLAGEAVVNDARLWAAPDNTRIVFDIDGTVEHKLFTLSKPDRLVIDLIGARLNKKLKGPDYSKGLIKRIRTGKRNQNDIRIVLDLTEKIKPKSFMLKPTKDYGYRLVLDLYQKNIIKKPKVVAKKKSKQHRDIIIGIDAGHGGEDPGAAGYRGTREKDVVMAIARKLQSQVRNAHGMRPVMIRDGDYYVGLKKRKKIARKNKVDMFISIHADAFRDKRASGASVYALSERGASNEAARWLAESENASDFIGGVSLDDKDNLLASVLLDLSQNGTIEASLELGSYVLTELKGVGKVHKRRVHQAGFAVLKSPDIPSILVETAFISNPAEERNLRSPTHQKKVARSIMRGIKKYFKKNSIPGTILAEQMERKYVIARGDTLSEIANRYAVNLNTLKNANGLKSNQLRIGKVLVIPGG